VTTFLSVVGARPNFMKVAPIHRALQRYQGRIRHCILHTGQHYDEKMSKVFFDDLELPAPDLYLGVGSGSHAEQTAKVMVAFEQVLIDMRPDLVIVVGDVNSTLACSVTASKLGIPVAHVEAGLRSFDREMPEEINRLVTDVLADYLFVTERAGLENLAREGVPNEKVFFVGHVMIDSLAHYLEKARATDSLARFGLEPKRYTLVTLHRPSNVDVADNLRKILRIFEELHGETRILFPVHPRTRNRLQETGLADAFQALEGLTLCDPIGYLDFLALMDSAALVLTDSGGIQEETTYLQVPCITLRENTERPVTVDVGTNLLLGLDVDAVVGASRDALQGRHKHGAVPELWDGHAADRIVDILARRFLTD
jgi:UDP-N-acetylglucosamine 2-epimerase (non-hydrolysing)